MKIPPILDSPIFTKALTLLIDVSSDEHPVGVVLLPVHPVRVVLLLVHLLPPTALLNVDLLHLCARVKSRMLRQNLVEIYLDAPSHPRESESAKVKV